RYGILRQYRFTVVEFEVGPQLESPSKTVPGDALRCNHLSLRLQLTVHAVQHVPDEESGIASDICSGPDRVEIGEIGMRHQAQGLRRRALRDRRRWERACSGE